VTPCSLATVSITAPGLSAMTPASSVMAAEASTRCSVGA
jgi:hypothetical protein